MTKEDLISATKQRRLHVVKNFYKDFPSWKDINDFYDRAKETKTVDYNSFGTMIIQDYNSFNTMIIQEDERVLDYYKKALSDISLCHKGHVLFSMMIIHFINRNNNAMTDKYLSKLFSKVNTDNPNKKPEGLRIHDNGVDGDSWDPEVHSDAQDRFFIQGSGQSLWKVFHDNKELNYEALLSEGDAAYIPKGVIHSVESMCPRHSVSIAFSDDPEITSLGMV